MAVTEALSALSTTAASNTPAGTDSIGTDLDDHLRDIKKNVRFASNHPVQAAKITAYTVVATDHNTLLQVNATASAVTVTMLAVATAGDGFRVGVKRLNGNTNKVTVDGSGSEKIDTTLTSVLTTLNEVQWYVCDGSNWQTEADYKSYNVAKGSDIASSTTPTIPTDGNYFDVTGTTTIVTFVVNSNRHFFLQFDAAVLLTFDATNLDLPSGANITTAAGDVAEFFSTGSNDVQCVNYTRADGSAVAGNIGKQSIWIPSGSMRPTVSNGCAALTDVETTAGRPDMTVLDFDDGSDEHAQFQISFPKSWNEGTITFQVYWQSTATDTDGVTWGLQGLSVPDNTTIDAVYGTAVVVDDANQGAAEEMLVTAESDAVTISNAAVDCTTFFRVFRDVSDANDTAAEDARLIGVKLFWTTDAGNDA